jgi:hypothetical protein
MLVCGDSLENPRELPGVTGLAREWSGCYTDRCPSALGGFARSVSGHSYCRCAYPNDSGRCCVWSGPSLSSWGGDSGSGQKLCRTSVSADDDDAFFRQAAPWRHRRKTPPPLDPQVLLGCWLVAEISLGCCFGAKEVCWR